MSTYTGLKITAFKASVFSGDCGASYKGRIICYENGRRLWQETSPICRMTRADAVLDAQRLAAEYSGKKESTP